MVADATRIFPEVGTAVQAATHHLSDLAAA
jgi:hypothetical protein